MSSSPPPTLSVDDVAKSLRGFQTAVEASSSALQPLLASARACDASLDMSAGLSLLLIRPQVLLASLHNMVLLLAYRLSGSTDSDFSISPSMTSSLFSGLSERDLSSSDALVNELVGESVINQETWDKVRSMESKLEYQIKKLSALAEAEKRKGAEAVEDAEEDPLSFRPNLSAMSASAQASGSGSGTASRPDRQRQGESSSEVYRPPRVAAMPYNEPTRDSTKKERERRAPALLSEFANTMDGTPLLETTSGLSTLPVRAHTNSSSSKRAAELRRINEFEEENMTRLVTTKREAKRRREDEAALALGYGVGGTGRQRGNRQNGLEAELEGVLGERRSKGVWEGVSKKMGGREGILDKGKRGVGEERPVKAKKARFEKDMQNRRNRKA